jgi:hypothetical protein
MIVDSVSNKWNASYYATQILNYAVVGANGLAICVDAVKDITTTASVAAQTVNGGAVPIVPNADTNKATNATTIYNILVQSASSVNNLVDCANIQTMMGPDTPSQLKQLDLMLGKISLPVLNKYSYFFIRAGYSIADLLGNLTPLILQETGLSSTTSGQLAWPTLLAKNVNFLAGGTETTDKVQVPPAIVLSYYRNITACNKLTGSASSAGPAVIRFIFPPAEIQSAYGLSTDDLNALGLEQGFIFN